MNRANVLAALLCLVAGFAWAQAIPNSATNAAGVTKPVTAVAIVDGSGNQITTLGSGFPADVLTTGTLNSATSNAAYTVTLGNGEGVTAFAVSGLTASGATLTVEASDDGGTNWAAVNGIAPSTGILFSTLTADQQFRVNTGGRTKVRLRVSSTGTGTINIASNSSSVSSAVALSSPIPQGTNFVGDFGLDKINGSSLSLGNTDDAHSLPFTLSSTQWGTAASGYTPQTGASGLLGAMTGLNILAGQPDLCQASGAPGTIAAGTANLYCDLAGNLRITIQNTPTVVLSTVAASAHTIAGCSVGVTSAQCLATATATDFIQVQNASASGGANIACSWGGTAILNDKGSFQLQPGQSAQWNRNTAGVPTGALNCIASGAATQLYLEYH